MAMMLVLAGLAAQAVGGNGTIWIEAETPTSANVKFDAGAPGRPELLSGGRWLTLAIDADKPLPPEGARLIYAFRSDAGRRELWHRVGFEAARAPFDWSVDGGPWHSVSPSTRTIDLTELATWNGVAWMDMGAADLTEGDHRLEIRIQRPQDSRGKPGNILYGSDAFALASGPFHPYGKWQPGQDPRTARDRAAEERVFSVADRPGPERQVLELGGDWEISRDDEISPGLVAIAMAPLDQNPVWTAISVPGDKAELRPDLTLAHRVWYRTRLNVPTGQMGRSFALTFRQNSLNTTVIVNGKPCGFNKNPFVNWTCDVTTAVRPGINEVRVGIRDAWYGFRQRSEGSRRALEQLRDPHLVPAPGLSPARLPGLGVLQIRAARDA